SPGGRWRLMLAGLRTAGLATLIVALGWGAWQIAAALQEKPRPAFATARGGAAPAPKLKTDGVLDDEWLKRTLALPKSVSLVELDLAQLHEGLLADRQVLTASLTRNFPDRLMVQITERTPVARVMTELAGERQALLVARDGVVFAGT